jgi:sporulation-control protein spo0M
MREDRAQEAEGKYPGRSIPFLTIYTRGGALEGVIRPIDKGMSMCYY